MEFTSMIVPEVVSGFGVYDIDGNELIGITDELSMAELASNVATIAGAGIAGSYDMPVLGHLGSITQDIPFRVLYKPAFRLANPMKQVGVTVRGAIQVTNRETMLTDLAGLRYVVRGRSKTISPGTLKIGGTMDAKVSIEAIYILYEIDGVKLIEIDKLNNIYRIEGVDLMEKLRKLC